jgi:hypothetical protein
MSEPPDDDDEADAERRRGNIILAVGLLILIGCGLWLVNALYNVRKTDECIASGRRNCVPIEVPSK